ncbi:hypothetical protein KSP39_PZI007472 [Platanthera zijinensis]|uniref:NAB domain-containing protein n=1 Tax=Platanthera zijinensis TaxID=2320716 RepID=A0AAP0BPA5_9ASPA
MLNMIEGDADSFAQRAEIYYSKRPVLVNMIEDFYRSYRYLAEQHELLRSETSTRRSSSFKCDSSIQNSPHKAWDSTDTSDYPESEVSELDDLEPEVVQIKSTSVDPSEEIGGLRRNLGAKSSVLMLQSNLQLEHHDEVELMDENDQLTVKPMDEKLDVSSSPVDFLYSKDGDSFRHYVCKKDNIGSEMEDYEVDDVSKMMGEVEGLKLENRTLMAELERKDEEKRHVIRQLSMAVDLLKEENVGLKKFIRDSRRPGSIFEFKRLKDAFSRTGKLFALTSKLQPSLVAL